MDLVFGFSKGDRVGEGERIRSGLIKDRCARVIYIWEKESERVIRGTR